MTASSTPPVEARILTLAKLRIYQAYRGDVDGWARRGGGEGMTDDDWQRTERLRQEPFLAAAGRGSPQFAAATERRLRDATDGEPTREALRELARAGRV